MPVVRAANYRGYYWVIDQGEIATDVIFKTRAALLAIWPDLVHHAALDMSSEDVLGFLGRKRAACIGLLFVFQSGQHQVDGDLAHSRFFIRTRVGSRSWRDTQEKRLNFVVRLLRPRNHAGELTRANAFRVTADRSGEEVHADLFEP